MNQHYTVTFFTHENGVDVYIYRSPVYPMRHRMNITPSSVKRLNRFCVENCKVTDAYLYADGTGMIQWTLPHEYAFRRRKHG